MLKGTLIAEFFFTNLHFFQIGKGLCSKYCKICISNYIYVICSTHLLNFVDLIDSVEGLSEIKATMTNSVGKGYDN